MKYIISLYAMIISWFTIYPINVYAADSSRIYDEPVSDLSGIAVLFICSAVSLCLAILFTYGTRKKR